ncbi:hypothetical protein [Helicobacter didelphidarum]|nr:hypothetical protein [Helicobacter didelphidarum]
MKKYMTSSFLLLSVNALYADFLDSMPSHLTLNGGSTQTHNAIAYAAAQNYTFGNTSNTSRGNNFSISSTGTGRGTLILNATLPQNPVRPPSNGFINFYFGNVNISDSIVMMTNFDEFTLERQTRLINSDLTIKFGDKKDKVFGLNNANAQLILVDSVFSADAESFQIATKGAMLQATNSTIDLGSAKVSNYGSIEINGGSAKFGAITNIGYDSNSVSLLDNASTATFINNGGNITINGNFTNGGFTSSTCYKSFVSGNTCGGGILINNGGTITINGSLTSEGNGLGVSDDGYAYLGSFQPSSIQLYGGTLQVNGDVTNKDGSTLTFGAYNGIMGKIEGNLTNENGGKIIVDIRGANAGNHTLVTGDKNGWDTNSVQIVGGTNNEFLNVDKQSEGQINIVLNQNAITAFQTQLTQNQSGILNALDSQFSNIYSFGGGSFLKNVANNIADTLYSSYVATPLAMIDWLKSNLALSEYRQMNNTLSVSVLGGGLGGKALGIGGLGGLHIGWDFMRSNHAFRTHIGYAYGNAQYNLTHAQATTQSHLVQVGLSDVITLRNIEVVLGAFGSSGFFSTERNSTFTDEATRALGQFNYNQISVDSSIGYRLSNGVFSLKPYIGLAQYLNIHNQIAESGDLTLQSKANFAYILSGVVGIENRYWLRGGSIFLGASYEYMLVNTHKNMAFELGANHDKLMFQAPLQHKVALRVGGDAVVGRNMLLGFEGFYKNSLQDIYYYGINASFRYVF